MPASGSQKSKTKFATVLPSRAGPPFSLFTLCSYLIPGFNPRVYSIPDLNPRRISGFSHSSIAAQQARRPFGASDHHIPAFGRSLCKYGQCRGATGPDSVLFWGGLRWSLGHQGQVLPGAPTSLPFPIYNRIIFGFLSTAAANCLKNRALLDRQRMPHAHETR